MTPHRFTATDMGDRLADLCGVNPTPAILACRFVAGQRRQFTGRAAYALTAEELAECVLLGAACGGGIGCTPNDRFLAVARKSGVVAALANLIELAEANEPEHLAESAFTIDADGAVLWAWSQATPGEVEVRFREYGGPLAAGLTITVNGSDLVEVLFDGD